MINQYSPPIHTHPNRNWRSAWGRPGPEDHSEVDLIISQYGDESKPEAMVHHV